MRRSFGLRTRHGNCATFIVHYLYCTIESEDIDGMFCFDSLSIYYLQSNEIRKKL
jgi:hypothetical protein